MADKSIQNQVGVVEDMLVKAFSFYGRALLDSEKYEITFRVKDEKMTFKVGKDHLLPDVRSISVVGMVNGESEKDALGRKRIPKKKKTGARTDRILKMQIVNCPIYRKPYKQFSRNSDIKRRSSMWTTS
ncbi:hypothetical protein HAX54_031996 [Datura stramonium]|uniref:Uncharacterized protein n=1 Tax=Datura stramonium TaxID=4076 RepID=A0ABS8VCE1_DATST|nr:hypothetical protein [Datura stramonium]